MDRHHGLVVIALAGLLGSPAAAQRRPYDLVMKDVGSTFDLLKTKDAIDAAKGARETSGAVAAAAKEKDLQKAKTAAAGLGRFCGTCHNSHREQMPDESYRIRP